MTRDARRELAILGYHKIGEPPPGEHPTWNYVPEATFVRQLEQLGAAGFRVVDLEAALLGLERPETLPERAALLSFDDGYRSMRTVALPLLRRFDHPAVLFVPTRFVGGTNGFDLGIEPTEPMCDWDELRELFRHGVAVQSHGVTHTRFSELGPEERREELVRSKMELEERLDRPVEVVAFPYGDEGAEPGALGPVLAEAGYRAACLYGGGSIGLPAADPFRLTRLAMGPDTDLPALLAA